MVTFTKQHYVAIADLFKEIRSFARHQKIYPADYFERQVDKFDNMFKEDNPRYESDKFRDYIFSSMK